MKKQKNNTSYNISFRAKDGDTQLVVWNLANPSWKPPKPESFSARCDGTSGWSYRLVMAVKKSDWPIQTVTEGGFIQSPARFLNLVSGLFPSWTCEIYPNGIRLVIAKVTRRHVVFVFFCLYWAAFFTFMYLLCTLTKNAHQSRSQEAGSANQLKAAQRILWSNSVVSDASSDESRHRGVQLLDRHNHASCCGCKPCQHEHSQPYDQFEGTQWVLLCRLCDTSCCTTAAQHCWHSLQHRFGVSEAWPWT